MHRMISTIGLMLVTNAVFAVDDIQLPPGFVIEEYADVPNARSLALGANGTLFVSNRRESSVYAVVEADGETETIELLEDLNTPNGIAFHDGDLYVAERNRVTRYDDIERHLRDVPKAVVLDVDLPDKSHHGWRYIGFSPSGELYISIGAPCNVCDEKGFGEIVRMQPDGSDRETFALGVRNSVGFAWHPDTDELWFTDNGRDMLGDDVPSDELNNATAPGQHFGYPYCHAGDVADPKYGAQRSCGEFREPAQKLGAHVAALGLSFYTGQQFPQQYRGQLFIAEHGSWNRSKKSGYRITLVRLQQGKPVSYEPFATGWLRNGVVSGRPVDIVIAPDGALLVSDDREGKIYRISYTQ